MDNRVQIRKFRLLSIETPINNNTCVKYFGTFFAEDVYNDQIDFIVTSDDKIKVSKCLKRIERNNEISCIPLTKHHKLAIKQRVYTLLASTNLALIFHEKYMDSEQK